MFKKYCAMFLIVLLLGGTMSSTSYADYDTTNVYTTIGEDRYWIKDGNQLYKNDNLVMDLTRYTWPENKAILYTSEMAKTLLITDITYDMWGKDPILFMVGVAFKVNPVNFNDSESYENMKVYLGTPYFMVLSYNLNGADVAPYNKVNNIPIHMEGSAMLVHDWDMPYKFEFNEVDDSETFKFNYNFADKLVAPKIIMSKYHPHTAYVSFGTTNDRHIEQFDDQHIKVESIKTTRNDKDLFSGEYSKQQFYATYKFFEDEAKANKLDGYSVKNHGFYIVETGKDKLMLINEGNDYSISVEVDVTNYGYPRQIQSYWKKNE